VTQSATHSQRTSRGPHVCICMHMDVLQFEFRRYIPTYISDSTKPDEVSRKDGLALDSDVILYVIQYNFRKNDVGSAIIQKTYEHEHEI